MSNTITQSILDRLSAVESEQKALRSDHATLMSGHAALEKRVDRLERIWLQINQYCEFFVVPEGIDLSPGEKSQAGIALNAVCRKHNFCTTLKSKGWGGSRSVYPIVLLERFFDFVCYAGESMASAADALDKELRTIGIEGIRNKLVEDGGICARLSV